MEKVFIAIFIWILLGFIGVSIAMYRLIYFDQYWYIRAGNSVNEDVKTLYLNILTGPVVFFRAIWAIFTKEYAGKKIFGLFNIFGSKKLKQMHKKNVLH